MKQNRIYGKKVEINTEHTRDFYNSRAKNIKNMNNPYVSVLLGDRTRNMRWHGMPLKRKAFFLKCRLMKHAVFWILAAEWGAGLRH